LYLHLEVKFWMCAKAKSKHRTDPTRTRFVVLLLNVNGGDRETNEQDCKWWTHVT